MGPTSKSLLGGATRGAVPLLAAAAIGLFMQFFFGPWIGAFPTTVLTQVGIAVILAVSLNIVNGYTGQFSIGHAGFMLTGGYVGAAITFYGTVLLWGDKQFHGGALSWTND